MNVVHAHIIACMCAHLIVLVGRASKLRILMGMAGVSVIEETKSVHFNHLATAV